MALGINPDPLPSERPVRVILLGPPGAGKGTQAALVAAHLGVPRISTGDMLRDAIARGTSVGKQAAPVMEKGGLVPDELLLRMMEERLAEGDCRGGYVLDGFPRTLKQAEGLGGMLRGKGELVVFDVVVPRSELLRRLSGRRWCPLCQSTYHVDSNPPKKPERCDKDGTLLVQREDDKDTAVSRRLTEYVESTRPLIDYYRGRSTFHEVNGDRLPDEVFASLKDVLEAER